MWSPTHRLKALFAAGLVTAAVLVVPVAQANGQSYLVGRGTADITGEVAEDGMLGYAQPTQTTHGIHLRQRARSFVIAEPNGGKRVAMTVTDTGMMLSGVRDVVLNRLRQKFGDAYTDANVLLSATHTHAAPGGFSDYTLYNVTTLGFHRKTFDALVDGIVDSISAADADLKPGGVTVNRGTLTDAGVNRSRRAFDRNPAQDKAVFPDAIDPVSTLLRLDHDGRPVGALNWFATHGTSLTSDNLLISGDNKGYAAWAWEQQQPGFVAGFAQTNPGDISPNLALKPGTGPTEDQVRNTEIIGRRQLDSAQSLASGGNPLSGGIDSRISYVDISKTTVDGKFTPDGKQHRTCNAAMGASFAAGSTEDGPGPAIFHEGAGSNPLIEQISKLAYTASPELKACQAPKDILLPVGDMGWVATTLPVQLLRIGELYIAGIPQEPTIVAGLRLRRTIAAELGVPMENVLVNGYANDYAGYLTTPEEYQQQDYEGGHTMYGQWELPAYQQEFARIAADMHAGRPSASPQARPQHGDPLALQPGVVMDAPPLGQNFGDVLLAPKAEYRTGETVRAQFAGAHPNNDLHRGGGYLEVQRREGDGWRTVAKDGDWSTTFRWARLGIAASTVTIDWTIPPGTQSGDYRIVYHGDAKPLLNDRAFPITGSTGPFRLR
ncbi:alkaline ceramidase [Pseudonocardiaceae bacterium YIM PH 21723]|nr:alkaline ceramidase [Pseudonocardiaceae bacterium YIM PH 21723]